MAKYLSGTYTSTYSLTINPTTVTSVGRIDVNTTNFGVGLFGQSGTAWTVTNFGTVESTGTNGEGIDLNLAAGGLVTNGASGSTTALISGQLVGIVVGGSSGTVTNYGLIVATGTLPSISGSTGVLLNTGGSVSNLGTIQATGTKGIGVDLANLQAGGSIINGASNETGALIAGSLAGIFARSASTISNFGTIEATARTGAGSNGVHLSEGGRVQNGSSNNATAQISAGANGIYGGGVVLTNGTRYYYAGAFTNVTNYGAIVSTGSYAGVRIVGGGSVINRGLITGGAYGVKFGGTAGSGTVFNFGTIIGTGGTAISLGTLSGTSTAIMRGTVGADLVVIESSSSLQGVISNVRPGDQFDLPFMPFSTSGVAAVVSGGTIINQLKVVENGGTFTIALDPNQNFAGDFFQLGTDASGTGTLVTDKIGVVDIIPATDSGETGQNSEPSIAVNPTNPNQIIAGAFSAYVGPTVTTPYFISTDGGITWSDFTTLMTTDKSLAWKTDGSAFLTARLSGTGTIDTFSGTAGAGGFGTAINTGTVANLDQPWIRTGPANHVYTAYNNLNGTAGRTASVDVSTDGGNTFRSVVIDQTGGAAPGGFAQDAPAVRVAVSGTIVYAAFTRWNSVIATNTATGAANLGSSVVVVRDDNAGADSFRDLGTAGAGALVAVTDSFFAPTPNDSLSLGEERAGSDLAITVDPNNTRHVLVAYATAPAVAGTIGNQVQLIIAESTDSGATWTNRFTTSAANRSAQPALAILANGAIGFLYDAYTPGGANVNANGMLSQHFLTTSDDFATSQDTVLATETNNTPALAFSPYVGDYFDLTAVGNTFYGAFSASDADTGNTATGAAFGDVTFLRNYTGTVGQASFQLVDGGGAAVGSSIDPFFFEATALPATGPVCFCRGTLIETERGELPVEELTVGDRVRTLSGALKPIRWIGFGRDLVTRRNSLARPIIVKAGALADDVPKRDLYLTHGHALYFDGVLIPVENLVNHRSIVWDETARVVEYYHIELEDHDVVLAEGAPAETYYDVANRALFHNTRPGSTAGDEKPTCAPVLNGGDEVERVWMNLFERAGRAIETITTDDPDLHVVIDGVRLDPTAIEGSAYRFAVIAPPVGALHLSSNSGVPSLLGITRHDHRRLGVAISRIELAGEGIITGIAHDALLLTEGGCHPPEADYSWTDGDLALSARLFAQFTGSITLTVHTERPGMRYPLTGMVADADRVEAFG